MIIELVISAHDYYAIQKEILDEFNDANSPQTDEYAYVLSSDGPFPFKFSPMV